MMTVSVKRKEATYLRLNLSLNSSDEVGWADGSYTVYAAKSRKALAEPYSEYDGAYLYQILSQELITESPNIANGELRIPLTVDRLDYTEGFVLLVKADFGTKAVYKQVIDINIALNDAN